jgi:Tfp pilus assembly protein PilP
MRISRLAGSFLIIGVAIAAVVVAQPGGRKPAAGTGTAATTATTTGTAATTTTASVQQTLQEILEEPAAGDNYRYDPQGRRDPFQSLIGPAPRLQAGQRPPGVPGFLIDEIKLTGIFRRKQELVAMIVGPDNKGHLIRVGDRVLDGEVIRITPSSVVFRQEVNDPTRIERYREVVKDLLPEASRK